MTEPDAPDADVPSRFHVDFEGRTLLGTYRVDQRLAEGGMGAVYLAQDLNLGRRVVVKVPHVRFLAEAGFRARFRREITELVRLEHPSIVRILAQGEEDEIPFFVLQYLGGGSLEDRLVRGTMSPEEVMPWLARVAETLDYVHGQGVVHRDVKPANILFDEQGHVFLSDFGVVKALEPEDGAALTEAGTGIGSPVYMAPEQALGQAVGPAADQYALASTAFEALVGEPPFGRGSAVEVILRKARGDAPSPREQLLGLPLACQSALARALAVDPASRFPWCVAFTEAFREGLASAPTQAFEPAPRRSRRFVATFATAAALGAAGLAYLGTRPRDPATGAPPTVVDEAPGVLLRLASPGAAPHAPLRWAPPVGASDAATLRLVQTITRAVEGHPDVTNTHRVTQRADVAVERVGPAGVTLGWELSVPEADPSGDHEAEEAQRVLAGLGRGVGTSVLSPRGVATDLALRYRGEGAGRTELKVALEEVVRMLSLPLPAEPVGVGAEWDATQLLEVSGVRYQQTLTCRLVARDGDRLTVAAEVRFTSPPQRMAPPAGDAAKAISMTAIEGDGRVEVVVDLRRPVPVSLVSTGTLAFSLVASADGVSRKIRFTKAYETEATAR